MPDNFLGGRSGVAGAVIATALDSPTAEVTEAQIEAILREWRVGDSSRRDALTYAYFGHLR